MIDRDDGTNVQTFYGDMCNAVRPGTNRREVAISFTNPDQWSLDD